MSMMIRRADVEPYATNYDLWRVTVEIVVEADSAVEAVEQVGSALRKDAT